MDRLLFELISNTMFDKEYMFSGELSPEEWTNLYNEAKHQNILGVLYPCVIDNESMPEELRLEWKSYAIFLHISTVKQYAVQNRLIKLLERNAIHSAVIKGSAVGVYFPYPMLRKSSDIDVIVKKSDYASACEVLSQNNYSSLEENEYHKEYTYNNVHIELHQSLSRVPHNRNGKYLLKQIDLGLDTVHYKAVSGNEFSSLPTLQNGLVLIRHVLQHLIEGIGIRQMLDWMMFVYSELHDEQWEVWKKEYEKCGLADTAKIATRTCQIYLGLTEQNITWCNKVDEKDCSRFISYIMSKGFLGCKEKGNGDYKAILALTKDNDLASYLKRLQVNGEINWKACQKYSILKCFAWAYTLVMYFVSLRKRYGAAKMSDEDYQIVKDRKKLYKKMGCYNSSVIVPRRARIKRK